jgi:carbon monoxide dehydrogenase subunit G
VDIEKTLTLAAPPAAVWALLLDPNVMGECVPGMQSVDVVSDTEYRAVMAVKIAFVSAKFKIRTLVVEQRAPHYLKTEGTGDDSSVASSFKQTSEMFLDDAPGGGTQLRMKVKVDVLGRLGTFGLNVMKTKADRMWDEFGAALAGRLAPAGANASTSADVVDAVPAEPLPATQSASQAPAIASHVREKPSAHRQIDARAGWLARLLGLAPTVIERQPGDIAIEVRRGDATVTVLWPENSANECAAWLKDYLRQPA